MILIVIVFFGYRALNAENIHSYEEGTPEQRASLTHSFGPKGTNPGAPPNK